MQVPLSTHCLLSSPFSSPLFSLSLSLFFSSGILAQRRSGLKVLATQTAQGILTKGSPVDEAGGSLPRCMQGGDNVCMFVVLRLFL